MEQYCRHKGLQYHHIISPN